MTNCQPADGTPQHLLGFLEFVSRILHLRMRHTGLSLFTRNNQKLSEGEQVPTDIRGHVLLRNLQQGIGVQR
jgi:hypothetical protein